MEKGIEQFKAFILHNAKYREVRQYVNRLVRGLCVCFCGIRVFQRAMFAEGALLSFARWHSSV